jgi:hypothetical protein
MYNDIVGKSRVNGVLCEWLDRGIALSKEPAGIDGLEVTDR